MMRFSPRCDSPKVESVLLPTQRHLVLACGLACLVVLLATLFAGGPASLSKAHAQTALPTPSHVVMVIENAHSYNDIIGSSSAPYINSLAQSGASFTQSFAITHPSQPNYLALFSGSTQGITDDVCPHPYGFAAPDLGGELIHAGLTFTGYSEDEFAPGSTDCWTGNYVRQHNPWVDFTDVPSADNQPWTSFPSDYSALPTVSIVVPNQLDDMTNGTVAQGDSWLQQHLDGYCQLKKFS